MVMHCFYLIPGFDVNSAGNEESECLLPDAHEGYHLNKLNNGNYLSWGRYSCDEDCGFCGECFNYLEISEAEALAIITDPSKNNHD